MAVDHVFECEIRDLQDHTSDVMADDTDVTVTTDDLHPNDLRKADSLRVYIDDDHDYAFDLTLQHTHPGDSGFTATVDEPTISIASGSDSATTTLDGPLGSLRFHITTAASTAATTGSLTVRVLGTEEQSPSYDYA